MKNKLTTTNLGVPNDAIQVDIQKFLMKILSYWWLILICIVLSVSGAWLYLRYTTFEYSAKAILLIKEAGRSGKTSEQSILMANEDLSGGGKSLDNEIQILKSLTLMERVVERLNLNVAYFRKGNVKESELYTNAPFVLDSFELKQKNGFSSSFYFELEDYESFIYKTREDDPEGQRFYYGVPFETAEGKFKISYRPEKSMIPGQYRVTISSLEVAANSHRFDLILERLGDQNMSSVLQLTYVDPVPEKARDILNTLIDIYNEEEVNDENKILRNTIEFIDKRVASLVGELDSVEGVIQRFKSGNELISNNAASSMNYTLGEIRAAVQQISSYEIQKDLLQSLEKFMTEDKLKNELIPVNLIAESPTLSGLVNQYNALVLRNKQISATASESNPARMALEREISDLRGLILETLRNLQRDLEIPVAKIEKNIKELKGSMSTIPGIEKRLVEKMRMQAIKENLFLYLLQKREETSLSEAIATAKTRTIDRARLPKFPVYPKRKLVMAASVLLGIFVPLILILIIGLFDTKVESEETIKQLTSIPILGRIAYKKTDNPIVVKQGSRSVVNEMFRLLRTNLNFINKNKPTQTIMVTSSISGEGKTFVAVNLGITIALSGKKVVILGLDLRKPKLGEYLGVTEGVGISNYLIGQKNLDEILRGLPEHAGLSYITCGPIPPNPGELLLSERMGQLLEELSEKFDYILIDTPPIGLVSDALLLRDFLDNILIIVKSKFTRKIMLKNLEQMYQNDELKSASIIFNGIKRGKRYYGYGGYYYGHDQKYYVEDD